MALNKGINLTNLTEPYKLLSNVKTVKLYGEIFLIINTAN